MKDHRNPWLDGLVALLLLMLFAQSALTAARTSLTIDEGLHITSGYSILRTGDYRLVEEHPPLTKFFLALPVLPVPDLPDVRTLPGWESDTSVLDSMRLVRATQALIYAYTPIDRLVVPARLSSALLAVLLGALVFRWAKDLAGWLGGVLALFLLCFDPNILAHASVAGTDLGAVCFMTLAMFAFWRFIRKPTSSRMVLAGITLGLAQAAQLTSLLLLPIEALIVLWLFIRDKRKTLLGMQVGIFTIAALVLWAVYDFQVGYVPGVSFPVPAASHAIPWLRLQQHIAGGHAAFLLGQVSQTGWWYYFPVAFALKTPLPTLILLAVAIVIIISTRKPSAARKLYSARKLSARQWLTMGLFPLLYFASSMANPLNIGYRHLLPMLPFVFVLIGSQISNLKFQISSLKERRATLSSSHLVTPLKRIFDLSPYLLVFVFLMWNIFGTVRLFPHYLAYFNELAGGPDGGWRYLADSNTDWGQALKDLAAYQRAEGIQRVRLSMFTFIDPAVYGVHYEPLTPMLGKTPAIFPSRFNPPPGDYVISATTLQGIPLADPEMFDWFRKQKPDAKIGHVMFVYRVRATEPHSWLAQCTTPVTPLEPPQAAEGFGRDDLRLTYFDCSTSWLYPTGGQSPGWFALAKDAQVGDTRWLDMLRLAYEQKRSGFTPPFRIYESNRQMETPTGGNVHIAPSSYSLPDVLATPKIDLPVTFEGGLMLLGYALDRSTIRPGEAVHLETIWRIEAASPGRLLSLMAHALGPDGNVVAAGDGLGVPIESWQPGDVFIQRHTLTVPKEAPAGPYWIQTGVYWLDNGKRWAVQDARAMGDRVLLTSVELQK